MRRQCFTSFLLLLAGVPGSRRGKRPTRLVPISDAGRQETQQYPLKFCAQISSLKLPAPHCTKATDAWAAKSSIIAFDLMPGAVSTPLAVSTPWQRVC